MSKNVQTNEQSSCHSELAKTTSPPRRATVSEPQVRTNHSAGGQAQTPKGREPLRFLALQENQRGTAVRLFWETDPIEAKCLLPGPQHCFYPTGIEQRFN